MDNFSIIIPVYNEEKILASQIDKMVKRIDTMKSRPTRYEIILVENGSTDNTYKIARDLKLRFKNIRTIKLHRPSYGQAFRTGIKKSRHGIIIQFDLDFWNIAFLEKSLELLKKFDIVIGSKNLGNSADRRSVIRKIISKLIEKSIKLRFATALTDSHGLKVIKKEKVTPFIDNINCGNHFFDTELLLKCFAFGATFTELPVKLTEIRKSRFPYLVRTIEVLQEYSQLMKLNLPIPSLQTKPKLTLQRG